MINFVISTINEIRTLNALIIRKEIKEKLKIIRIV